MRAALAFLIVLGATAAIAVAAGLRSAGPSSEDFYYNRASSLTLIDTQTGRIRALVDGATGANSLPTISSDERWLVFSRGSSEQTSRIYRIDLESDGWREEYLVDGLIPIVSPDGSAMLFYRLEDPGDSDYVTFIRQENGSVRQLSETFANGGWSPDGRYLAYRGPYRGVEETMDFVLFDTETWDGRVAGQSRVCQCDAPYDAAWAPNGDYFVYPFPADGSGVASIAGEAPSLARPGPWTPDGRLFWREPYGDPDNPDYRLKLYDFDSESSLTVYENFPSGRATEFAPDGSKLAVEAADSRSAGQPTVSLIDVDEGVVASGIPGRPHGWSGDGRFFSVYSEEEGACGRALGLYDGSSGELIRCLEDVAQLEWSPAAASFVYTEVQDADGSGRPPAVTDLLMHDAATGESRVLAEDVAVGCFRVGWSPDGRYLTLGTLCGI